MICVNPDHLEIVTNKENILRGIGITAINAKKTHCIRGHKLVKENLIIEKNGSRQCRICKNTRNAEFMRRNYHNKTK